MNQRLRQQLMESGYVHFPMRADEERTMEAAMRDKAAWDIVPLWDGRSLAPWRFVGEGHTSLTPEGALRLETPATLDHWPGAEARAHDAQSGAYATFGSFVAHLDVRGLNLRKGNRIRFSIRPLCDGLHSPVVRVGFVNNGAVKIPDQYSREGFNAINLKNGVWNTCFWEIESIAHDRLEEISFEIHRYGRELSAGDTLRYELKEIRFERVEAEQVLGWQCRGVAYSTGGYALQGRKTAIASTAEKRFSILRDDGTIALEGAVGTVENARGTFQTLDFSALREPGEYRIRLGSTTTESFPLSACPWESGVWKLLNFLFCERCGYPVPGKHGTCHADVTGVHNGVRLAYNGGWHDAADVSMQTVQNAEIVDALLEMAESARKLDPMLHSRLMEEALWGIDFLLRTRFGDGYRVAAANIRRWTNGAIGDMDDCDAVVHNHSFENYIAAGVEARGALALDDAALKWKCLDSARADYAFAEERYAQTGVEAPDPSEHASSASESQYAAAAAWAAAWLFRATGDEAYQRAAERHMDYLLACQETGAAGLPFDGFFYRKPDHRVIVHFSHQAREQIFMQALDACCRNLPDDARRVDWEAAIARYGAYLKALTRYTEPYGMLPAGVFHQSEADDAETFPYIHPHVQFERERENYRRQLQGGVEIAPGYYVKAFPVWFSFRGNSAVHLTMGKAAAIAGRCLKDETLTEIAREQLYWTLGKNPAGQSLIYGEGSRYGQEYTALLGETVGEIPVGVQTRGCGDEPYWPQANIATYREVWTTPAGRWLGIAAELV